MRRFWTSSFCVAAEYALAGAFTLTGVTDPTKQAELPANRAEIVEVPLDVVLSYFFRAKRYAASARLAWLQSKAFFSQTHYANHDHLRQPAQGFKALRIYTYLQSYELIAGAGNACSIQLQREHRAHARCELLTPQKLGIPRSGVNG